MDTPAQPTEVFSCFPKSYQIIHFSSFLIYWNDKNKATAVKTGNVFFFITLQQRLHTEMWNNVSNKSCSILNKQIVKFIRFSSTLKNVKLGRVNILKVVKKFWATKVEASDKYVFRLLQKDCFIYAVKVFAFYFS